MKPSEKVRRLLDDAIDCATHAEYSDFEERESLEKILQYVAKLERVAEAGRKRRTQGHNSVCKMAIYPGDECDCGQDDLIDALAALDAEEGQ